ncbi:MAG: B12-binding domain-containing radical SAM protein [Candidatus Aenigmarchaeota archaeon]|nr:B12-binding domain-containing radical SAM protein [Candidatus Aenigmarchaeota archaeon]
MKRVLFIYPSSSPDLPNNEVDFSRYKSVPVGLLAIATYIKNNGYDVRVIDGRAYTKAQVREWVEQEIKNPELLMVCVSLTTIQLKHGLQLCDMIKEKRKELPIVFGGIHPIMFPYQTIMDSAADYVVYGEGEYALRDILSYVQTGAPKLDSIKGIMYKKQGKPVMTPVQPGIDINDVPDPDYDLLEIEKYIEREFITNLGKTKKMRAMDISTSRGCPYRCNFCTNTMDVFKRYRPLALDRVFKLIDLCVVKYRVNHIWFNDDLFFVHKKRLQDIANYIIEKGYLLSWESNARVDQFRDGFLDDDLLALLKKSGCFALRMGMESGSNRVLELMKKDSTVDDIIHAVSQCEKHGIIAIGNFICGFPTETKEEVLATGRLILKLKEISPNGMFFSPGVLRPYPGTEMYAMCKEYGFKEPNTLREWASQKEGNWFFVETKDLPWIKEPEWLENFQVFFYILTVYKTHLLLNQPLSLPWRIMGKIAQWRFERDLWSFSIEPSMLLKLKKILDGDSLLGKLLKKIVYYV